MMGRIAQIFVGLGAVASLGAPAPARAQCRLCETPVTAPEEQADSAAVALEIEAGLDFDKLVLLGTGGGSAVLRPDGTREVSGAIESISGRAMVGQARVRGAPGRAVRIDLPGRIDLYSVGGVRITIEEVVTDLPAMPRLDSAGSLSFRFGGRLRVDGEPEGEFRGDLAITVEYL